MTDTWTITQPGTYSLTQDIGGNISICPGVILNKNGYNVSGWIRVSYKADNNTPSNQFAKIAKTDP